MRRKSPSQAPSSDRKGRNKPEILVGRWGEAEWKVDQARRNARQTKPKKTAWLSQLAPVPRAAKPKRRKGGNTAYWFLPPDGETKEIATPVGGQPGFKRKRGRRPT